MTGLRVEHPELPSPKGAGPLVVVAEPALRAAIEPGRAYTVGRSLDADFRIEGRRVSREHCSVTFSESAWTIRDLGSANGTFVEGRQVSDHVATGVVDVSLGDPYGPSLRLLTDGQLVSAANHEVRTADVATDSTEDSQLPPDGHFASTPSRVHRLVPRLKVGRATLNDIVLDDLSVSLFHAELRAKGDRVELVDLRSANGTFVNGQRISRALLSPGDKVAIAQTLLVFDGHLLQEFAEPGGQELRAVDLTVTVGSGADRKTLLHNVSFRLRPSGLLAIVGPSGSGKSTLLAALTGQRPADTGSVQYAGWDLYADYDQLRQRIGLVPQADLLHTPLTVKRALEYGAELRFPKDTKRSERASRVAEVMHELGLTDRGDLRIDRLSGGQRKRTSVALELLTKPSLLFLDEPTSGLDPGLDLQVMRMLRSLADDGRTVVVVTHSVENLGMCDDLLILGQGGHVAYFGPPDDAPGHFGVSDHAQIFLHLEQAGAPEPAKVHVPPGPPPKEGSALTEPPPAEAAESVSALPLPRLRRRHVLSQIWTLSRRYLAVIVADKAYLAFLAILPIMLAVLGILVGSSDGLAASTQPPEAGPPNYQARFLLLVLALGAAFSGAASSIQEVVKERTIYVRERAIGVSRIAYVWSKLLVLGAITAVQATAFAAISLAGRPGPAEALVLGHPTLEVIAATVGLAIVSMTLGLFISALIGTSEVALPLLVLATMVQVVLSGAVPIRFDSILDVAGWATPAYWAFSAAAATSDLGTLAGIDPAPLAWEHTDDTWTRNSALLLAWGATYVVLTAIALRRREPGPRRCSTVRSPRP